MIITQLHRQINQSTIPAVKGPFSKIIKSSKRRQVKFAARSLRQLKRSSRGIKNFKKFNAQKPTIAVDPTMFRKLGADLNQVKSERNNYKELVDQLHADVNQVTQERDSYEGQLNHIQSNLERHARRREYANLSSRYNLL